jgi:hypothetical protein
MYPSCKNQVISMTDKSKFWPFDFDPEDEIYDNPSWDMPGLRRASKTQPARNGRSQKEKR